MRLATSLIVVAILFVAGNGIAQDAAPCRQPVLAATDFLTDDWTVAVRTRLSANPVAWEETTATTHFERLSTAWSWSASSERVAASRSSCSAF